MRIRAGKISLKRNKGRLGELLLPVCIMAMLLLLLAAYVFRANQKISLHNVKTASLPAFSVKGVLDGSYQDGWMKWFNDNYWGRAVTVKLHNQIQYSVFRDGNGDWLLGKDGMIYSGDNALKYSAGGIVESQDQSVFDDYAKQVAYFQSELSKYNKDFVYLLTPWKVEIYPEMISWRHRLLASNYVGYGETNRDKIIKAFEKYGVHFYDMTNDILRLRDTADYEVFSKTGHHWTLTAVANEMSPLFDRIQAFAPHISFPSVTVTGVKDELYETDMDVYDNENVFFGKLSEEYISPSISYSDMSPNKVYIYGTSMCAQILDALAQDEKYRAFDEVTFQERFVRSRIVNDGGRTETYYRNTDPPSVADTMAHIRDSDLIIMESGALTGTDEKAHLKFLEYVNKNIGKLNYNLGDDLLKYTVDSAGASWINFYGLEPWGRWSKGDSTVVLHGNALKDASSDIEVFMTLRSYHAERLVDVLVNGCVVAALQAEQEPLNYAFDIPASLIQEGENSIELSLHGELYSPYEVGESQDKRYLGLGITSMALEAEY